MEIYGKSYYLQLNFVKVLIHLWKKLLTSCFRLIEIFRKFPVRLIRCFKHLLKGFYFLQPFTMFWRESEINKRRFNRISTWWTELPIYLLDIFGVPEFYEIIMDFVKFNSRSMYDWEIELAKTVFGESINYRRVRIDELSVAGPRAKAFLLCEFLHH